jgi:hypothetical protein
LVAVVVADKSGIDSDEPDLEFVQREVLGPSVEVSIAEFTSKLREVRQGSVE